MSATYPVDTLANMAAIPEDVLPRFLEELPSMLASIRRMQGIVAAANEAAGVDVLVMPAISGATWTDDDKREFRETITVGEIGGQPGFVVERSGKIGGAA